MTELPERYRTVTVSLDDALNRAIESHAQWDIDYAKYVCQRILQLDPGNVAARHQLRIIEQWRDPKVMIRNLVAPRISTPNPVIFDIGANQGNTIATYRSVFPTAVIHGFEPDPELAPALAERFRADSTVRINPVAIGASETTLPFNICRAAGNDGIGSFLDLNDTNLVTTNIGARKVGSVEVPVTTLDRYCAGNGIETVDFAKIDVQGFEQECLAGAAEMLGRHRIRMLQIELLLSDMYSRTLSFYDIEKFLIPRGYRLYAIDDVYPRLGAELFQLDAFYVAP